MKFLQIIVATITIILIFKFQILGQPDVNYNEAKIPQYTLPDPLIKSDGTKITSFEVWENEKREEIILLLEKEMFGKVPNQIIGIPSVKIIEENQVALNGESLRTQLVISFQKDQSSVNINILIYTPKNISNPPLFIGYNFYGNHTIIDDPNIIITKSWVKNNNELEIQNNTATYKSRGLRNHRWPVQKINKSGFGLVSIYYGDVDPDFDDYSNGIHPLFYESGQNQPKEEEWGAIASWSWGLSRVVDYLLTTNLYQASKYIAFGHSRLGKSSLWAGANDTRFDMVISNNSGCGGAALSKRAYGETVEIINTQFPHWFNANFKKYNNNEKDLPFDQHMLLALIAPRPLYIASAEEDKWADPKGEYLSAYHASEVYKLYNKQGLENPNLPQVNKPIHYGIGYHIRNGKHDVTEYDWEQYIQFARKHFN